MTLEDSAFWKEIAWRLAAAPDASATDAYLAGSFTGLARLLLEEHASTRALELVVALALLARAHVEAARSDRLLPPMLRMVTIEALPRRGARGAPAREGRVSPDVQAYRQHELERVARDLRAVADELERLAGGNASAEDVDRQVFTAAHLAGDLEVLVQVLAGQRSPPPQICAAGYPLDAATHPPDTIPCAHHPARERSKKT